MRVKSTTQVVLVMLSLLLIASAQAETFSADYEVPSAVSQPAGDAMRVLWWNILDGTFNREALATNLEALVAQPSPPHFLVLGEFNKEQGLPASTTALLEKKYPYRRFFPSSLQFSEKGIYVYGDQPVTDVAFNVDVLDWSDRRVTEKQAEAYKKPFFKADENEVRQWKRSYVRLTIEWKGKPVHIVPVHTAMPWIVMKKMEGITGSLQVGLSLNFGRENPLIYQIERLREEMKQDPKLRTGDPVLVLGDFNMPKAAGFPLPSSPYSLMKNGFRDTFEMVAQKGLWAFCRRAWEGIASQRTSFPTREGREKMDYRKFPNMQLDHGFVKTFKVQTAEVLPLRGSDHYPVLFDVQVP